MGEFADAFDQIADTELWIEAAALFAGFLLPTVLHNLAGEFVPVDLPDEAYGILMIAVAQFSPMYQGALTTGGALYTVDKAAERFDLKSTVEGVGA